MLDNILRVAFATQTPARRLLLILNNTQTARLPWRRIKKLLLNKKHVITRGNRPRTAQINPFRMLCLWGTRAIHLVINNIGLRRRIPTEMEKPIVRLHDKIRWRRRNLHPRIFRIWTKHRKRSLMRNARSIRNTRHKRHLRSIRTRPIKPTIRPQRHPLRNRPIDNRPAQRKSTAAGFQLHQRFRFQILLTKRRVRNNLRSDTRTIGNPSLRGSPSHGR